MPAKLEIGSKLEISPSFSTIFGITTTLKHSPLFPVGEGSAFEIMHDDFPIRVIVLDCSCPSNRGDFPQGLLSYMGNVLGVGE